MVDRAGVTVLALAFPESVKAMAYVPLVVFAVMVILVNIQDWQWRKTATKEEIEDADNSHHE